MIITFELLLAITMVVIQMFKVTGGQQCGVRKEKINELIVQGWKTTSGSFPWHAAIYHKLIIKDRYSYAYSCGGTLLNARFVMTADHCVKEDRFVLSPNRIFVRLGVDNLDSLDSLKSQQHGVFIHRIPEVTNKRNDIALLELGREAIFNEFVQPACINQEPDITGLLGIAVGWGLTEDDELSSVLKATRLPIVDSIQCLESNRDVFGLVLDSTVFCAGYTNNSTTVCNGDSGGGLHVKRGSAWFVVGIISFTTPRDEFSNRCRVDSYAAFTNVVVFVPWIQSIIEAQPKEEYVFRSELISATTQLPPQPQVYRTELLSTTSQLTKQPEQKSLTVATNNKPVVVCYIASWAYYRKGNDLYDIEAFDPKLCTHAIYAYAGLDHVNNAVKSLDSWIDLNWGKRGYEKLTGMRKVNPQLKVLISIGGWNEGSKRYSDLAANSERRQEFGKNALEFVKKHGFDGIDLDWEHPTKRGGKPYDRENYVLLVKELSQKFKMNKLLVTSTIGAVNDTIDVAYDIESLSKYLDYLHVTCYDYNGIWSRKIGPNAPLQSQNGPSVENTINHLITLGAPTSKIVLGLPFYGRTFSTSEKRTMNYGYMGFVGPSTKENGVMGYNKICETIKANPQKWTISWDAEASAAIATTQDGDMTRVIIYDNTRSITNKVLLASRWRLGGLMIWSVDMDDFNGLCDPEEETLADYSKLNLLPPVQGKYKLLQAVNNAISLALR